MTLHCSEACSPCCCASGGREQRTHPYQPDVDFRDEEPGVEGVWHVEGFKEINNVDPLRAMSGKNITAGPQF